MTSDGTNTYAWDAENRMIKITYPGTGNYSQFTYDALGHCAQITETSGGTITSTKQFVWWGNEMCEARNASSAVTAQYFSFGETINGTSYYYTKDHLGSIRELTNSSGVIQSQYAYDPYGQVTKIVGSGPASDFQYAGYYYHKPSGLNLTLNRAYNSNLGRWINRDPIEEIGGVNLYCYVGNDPIEFSDILGLQNCKQPRPKFPYNYPNAFWNNRVWVSPNAHYIWDPNVYSRFFPLPIPPGFPGNNPPPSPIPLYIGPPEPFVLPGRNPWEQQYSNPYGYIA